MIRIALLDDYPGAGLGAADWSSLDGRAEVVPIRDYLGSDQQIIARLADFDVLVLNRERTVITRQRLTTLPKLKLVVTFGMRNASVDMAAASDAGIYVCGTKTLGYPTAELSWALILALFRHIPLEAHAIAGGRWQTTVGRGLRGRVLGIAGLGRIGQDVAKVGAAFGMRVIAWSRSLDPGKAAALGVECVDRNTLFREADVLTLHLPLNKDTRGLVGRETLALMKPDAVLVNTARGALVDEEALVDALEQKRLSGAAIDTFEIEPVPPDHPLARFDNVILTPHLGYVIEENYRTTFGEALEDILAWLDGNPIRVIAEPAPEAIMQRTAYSLT